MSGAEEAISTYKEVLEKFPAREDEDAQLKILSILIARDTVAHALANTTPVSSAALVQLTALDQQLKASANEVVRIVSPSKLATLRETMEVPESRWWWHPDKPNPLWAIFTAISVIISVGLLLEIGLRFIGEGGDFLSVSEVLLALLAGTTLTRFGPHAIERSLSRLGIGIESQHIWKAGLALILFVSVLAFRLALPAVSRFYNDKGALLQQEGQLITAAKYYRRAISLNPDHAQAHYNLAALYEDMRNYDKAVEGYEQAIGADDKFSFAYNNLARLYILQHKDYAGALKILDLAFNSSYSIEEPIRTGLHYSILKNRGWAHLGLGLTDLAEEDLKSAIALRPDGAAAPCLMAQVIEAKNSGGKKGAAEMWRACISNMAGQEYEVEAEWIDIAQQRLSQGGGK